MKETGMLFNAEMVRALLDGRKTQTRRSLKMQPPEDTFRMDTYHHPNGEHYFWAWKEAFSGHELHTGWEPIRCPYGKPGDRIWVRETFADIGVRLSYRADKDDGAHCKVKRWVPSLHMPRAASRITLEITDVRIERLHDISEADAIAEGIELTLRGWKSTKYEHVFYTLPVMAFQDLWESTGGDWSANPWVWVIEFKQIKTGATA